MRSAWRGYHLWRQFYAPNQPILWRATLLPSATPKSTGRILPRAISEMSLRGSRGVANIRRFGARFGNLSPSLPHFPSILDNSPAHVSRTIRNPLRDWLRVAIFPTFSIDIASANEPEFFPNQLNFSPFFRTCWTCPRDSINAFAEAKAKKSKWIIIKSLSFIKYRIQYLSLILSNLLD